MFLNSLLADKAEWYPILFNTPMNAVRSVAIWLTLALAIAFVVCAILLKGERRAKFLKYSLIAAVAYAVVIAITLLSLSFSEAEIVTLLFVPLLILILVVAASAIAVYLKRNKIVYIVSGCALAAAVIAVLVCMGVLYASGDSLISNGITFDDVNQVGLYVGAVLLCVAVVVAAFMFDRKSAKGFDSKTVAYASICIAMSFALSYLRIVKMPQGGSITVASLVPLMLFSFMFGTRKGIFAGAIYGVLQAFQDPYILHPAQFILDFPAAFACIGLAGLFAQFKPLEKLPAVQFAIGGVIAGLCRFIMHYISGIFAFGSFAPEGQPAWLYSLIYQSGYVLPDIAIAIAVGVLLLLSPSVVRQVRSVSAAHTKKTPAATQPQPNETQPESQPAETQVNQTAETQSENQITKNAE